MKSWWEDLEKVSVVEDVPICNADGTVRETVKVEVVGRKGPDGEIHLVGEALEKIEQVKARYERACRSRRAVGLAMISIRSRRSRFALSCRLARILPRVTRRRVMTPPRSLPADSGTTIAASFSMRF